MDSIEVAYYTCLNNECPKHRNIFREGDPLHANCDRERLWLEGQRRPMPVWAWIAIPAAIALAAGAGLWMMRGKLPKNISDVKNPEEEHHAYDSERGSSDNLSDRVSL